MLSLLFLRIHTAQTRIAQLQPHFPAAARYRLHQLFQKMVQRTFLIRRQQNLTVDMFLDQMADTRIFAWLDCRKSAGEFCIGCCCFPAKTGIYAPQTKILVNSCFRSSDPPARPLLLLFLCRRSKADDPRRLRRNHKQRQQNQKHAKQPEKKQRNTAQYRKNGFACLALSVLHTGNLLRRQRIVLQHHILLDRIWTSDHFLKRCNIIQEQFVF